MINSLELSDLLTPLIRRAYADWIDKTLGFADRSAKFVLERLSVDVRFYDTQLQQRDLGRSQLMRCKWVDQRLVRFFAQAPKTLGVEINGGLSTRFHRLSEQLDWPQFYWCAINTPDINDCLEFVFPEIDHYHRASCNAPLEDWSKHVQWHDSSRKIIIIGENLPISSWRNFITLYQSIQDHLNSGEEFIDLILTHTIDDFAGHVAFNGLPVVQLDQYQDTVDSPNSLKYWLNRIFMNTDKPKIALSHLRIRCQVND